MERRKGRWGERYVLRLVEIGLQLGRLESDIITRILCLVLRPQGSEVLIQECALEGGMTGRRKGTREGQRDR